MTKRSNTKIRAKGKGVAGEKRRGGSGIANAHITRSAALRKLQISLKDFRRLCILKGVYPRDPKKTNHGKERVYYHKKDIAFMMHEPLMLKYRQDKVFLRKYNAAVTKKEHNKAAKLKENRPKMTLTHLVKERYPNFADALRDLDDPLNLIVLFASLPTNVVRFHSAQTAAECTRLQAEWQNILIHLGALQHVFVSVKGIYYQAIIDNQPITWLQPHKFKIHTPREVDYKVMFTFLDFYKTLIKFINFRLYYKAQMQYPPALDEKVQELGGGLEAFKMESQGDADPDRDITKPKHYKPDRSKIAKQFLSNIASIVASMERSTPGSRKKAAAANAEQADAEAALEDADKIDDFNALDADSELQHVLAGSEADHMCFKGLKFLLGRETPIESLQFVILAAGGEVVWMKTGDAANKFSEDLTITHHIVDRKNAPAAVTGRTYVQPQWVYDTFNCRVLLPTAPYAPGRHCPPHLCPFVDDEAVGHIPEQRKVLNRWIGKAASSKESKKVLDMENTLSDDEFDQNEAEAARVAEIAKERAGVEATAEDDNEDSDSEDSDGDVKMTDKQKRQQKRAETEHQMRVDMLSNKKKRLYSAMVTGNAKKEAQVEKLRKRAKKNKKNTQ